MPSDHRCWHCERELLVIATGGELLAGPEPETLAVCVYCGAYNAVGADLTFGPLPDDAFEGAWPAGQIVRVAAFCWARQQIMRRTNLARPGADIDRQALLSELSDLERQFVDSFLERALQSDAPLLRDPAPVKRTRRKASSAQPPDPDGEQ